MSIRPKLFVEWAATLCAAFSSIAIVSIAQQVTDKPKSPEATTTVDGRFLPNPPTPLGGEINLSDRDPRRHWPRTIVPPKTAPSSTLRATLVARPQLIPAPPPQAQA